MRTAALLAITLLLAGCAGNDDAGDGPTPATQTGVSVNGTPIGSTPPSGGSPGGSPVPGTSPTSSNEPPAVPIPSGPCVETGRFLSITRAAAAGVGDRIYIFGGIDDTGKVTSAVQRFYPSNGTISTVATLSVPRADMAVATAPDGYVYLVGGTLADGAPSGTITRFDPRTETFRKIGEGFSVARTDVSAVTDGEHIFVFGGTGPSGNLRNIDLVDLVTGGVDSAGVRLPGGRHSSAILYRPDHDQIVIAGGVDDRGQNSSEVFVYDIAKKTLTPGSPLAEGSSEQLYFFDEATGAAYLAGGRTDDGPSGAVYYYNATGAFQKLTPACRSPRLNGALATTDLGVFMIGGNDPKGAIVSSILKMDLEVLAKER